MSWKTFKEHFRIGHIVAMRKDGGINIGSGYVSELIIVKADGTFAWGSLGESRNDDLSRYYAEMKAAGAEKVRELIATPDIFAGSIPVYTYDGGTIIEKFCEVPGWPNITHDGEVMYENSFFLERAGAVECAKRNARAGVQMTTGNVERAEANLTKAREWLAEQQANLAKLEADYPNAGTASGSGTFTQLGAVSQHANSVSSSMRSA